MTEITQEITALPAPPTRQDRANFNPRADAFLPGLVTMSEQLATWTGQVNTLAGELNQANTDAQAAKNAAQAAQAAAEAVASAAAWASGTAYTTGQCVFGADGQTYRALDASTGVNPVGDTTGKWVRISAVGTMYSNIPPGGGFVGGGTFRLASAGTYALPADPVLGLLLEMFLDCVPSEAQPVVIGRSGMQIEGIAEDLVVDSDKITRWSMYFDGVQWRVMR